MKPRELPSVAQLLKESQDMLRTVSEWSGPTRLGTAPTSAPSGRLLAELAAEAEPVLDASLEVFIENEDMTVVAEFRPPGAGGKLLLRPDLEDLLLGREITHGLVWPAIEDALARCNLDHELVKDVVIARGSPAEPFVPEHVVLEPEWIKKESPDTEALTVDWKEVSPFILVRAGDQLAHRVREVEGSPGQTVKGRVLNPATRSPAPLVAGAGVVETPVGFEAQTDGRLVVEKNVFSVSPILDLLEGVNYKTGNILFQGDVVIHKHVADGFRIEAAGAISLDCVLDAWRVKCGKDLIAPAGVVGKPECSLVVGGSVTAKYLENVQLTAQGDVRVENSIMRSLIQSRGRVVVGDKGIIAGGSIQCLSGIDTLHVSTPTGPRTELLCGIDFQGMDTINELRESSRDFAVQLRKVEAAIPHVTGPQQAKLQGLATRLRSDQTVLMDRLREQLMALGQDEAATVTVRGIVWPDTVIEICHVRFLVTQKMKAVRFSLDKQRGTISAEPLKKS